MVVKWGEGERRFRRVLESRTRVLTAEWIDDGVGWMKDLVRCHLFVLVLIVVVVSVSSCSFPKRTVLVVVCVLLRCDARWPLVKVPFRLGKGIHVGVCVVCLSRRQTTDRSKRNSRKRRLVRQSKRKRSKKKRLFLFFFPFFFSFLFLFLSRQRWRKVDVCRPNSAHSWCRLLFVFLCLSVSQVCVWPFPSLPFPLSFFLLFFLLLFPVFACDFSRFSLLFSLRAKLRHKHKSKNTKHEKMDIDVEDQTFDDAYRNHGKPGNPAINWVCSLSFFLFFRGFFSFFLTHKKKKSGMVLR